MNLIVSVLLLVSGLSDHARPIHHYPGITDTTRILIINCFDATKMQARKNKKAFFAELTDSLKNYLHDNINMAGAETAAFYDGIVTDTSSDSILKLIAVRQATVCIAIKNIDALFEKAEVQTEKDDNGYKTTHVSYNIHSVVEYGLYNNVAQVRTSTVDIYQFLKIKSSLSGFFTVGPNIMNNKREAFEITKSNALHFLNNDYAEFRRK